MGVERHGTWEDDRVKELYGSPLSGVRETGHEFLRSEVRFLVPCLPSKVLAVGLNHASHREHVEDSEGVILNASGRPVPVALSRRLCQLPTSLIADGDPIVLPRRRHERALRERAGRNRSRRSSSSRSRSTRLQWFRAKGADGFGPIGPAIVTGLDINNLAFETRVNGEVRQSSNTRELVFSPQEILSSCSRYVTLLPGDVIFTGTPGKTQRVDRGDMIEVTIGGVGTLRNTVAGASR